MYGNRMGGGFFGVVRTDKWLEEDFNNPIKICERLLKVFSEEEGKSVEIYNYLKKFGMYKPNRRSYECFEALKRRDYWGKAEKIFRKYEKKWKGPNIPIYIFPIVGKTSIFSQTYNTKSGVAFQDKMFLFISPFDDDKELEALFVHEYHHVCRLHHKKKNSEAFTLLDSIILEGLAEHAVEECCGQKYKAKWCNYYSRKDILYFWGRYLKPKLMIKQNSQLHDEILFGKKNYPKMLGYSTGYEIVSMYKEETNFSLKDSFLLPSERFLTGLKNINHSNNT
ncbi:DUF2268 domain-containing protein [Cytobacillus dafuensis]|nr:DUF2268 domain-containing protein [Cytobacillus dafuensis]